VPGDLTGRSLASYRVTAKIGEGGMGEVWRATDTKLEREVAIKVLPEAFTSDPERLARFEREAKLLAQLHHPHIASIFGLEEADGVRGLVMELVEGPTLAERLEKGAPSLEESLGIARQIAEALEEAHEKGIVHRDLKPQNVKLTAQGQVKVLDFGLAKAMESDPAKSGADLARSPTLLNSPTLTAAGTQLGVILGTAGYMAPEQAAGGAADRRADIWAFGVVLWEMLSGRRLFEGETVSHVLAGVLKDEPDLSALPEGTPSKIRRLVRRCLAKKPRQRLQSIGDARLVIEEVLAGATDEAPAVAAPAGVRVRRPVWQTALALAAAVGAGALVALALGALRSPKSVVLRTLSEISLPPGQELATGPPAISPDGTRLALVLIDAESQKRMVWLRNLASGDLRPVSGTESARNPFWSPDGRSIGFKASDGDQIKRVDLDGGRPVPVARASSSCGATWGAEAIVFCDGLSEPLRRVSPSGGRVELATPEQEEAVRIFPVFLPDGRRFVYLERPRRQDTESRLMLGSVDGSPPRELLPADSLGWYDDGWIFYMRGETLLARRFDAASGTVGEGEPRIVAEGVSGTWGGIFSVASGLLVYAPSSGVSGSRISIYDRSGTVIDRIDSETFLDDLVLSPDGRRLAVMKRGNTAAGDRSVDVWTVDLARKVFARATYGENDDDPVFSPDGTAMAFAHQGDLYVRPVDGAGEPRRLVDTQEDIVTQDWTRDGWIVYSDLVDGAEDLFAVRADGGEPRRLTTTSFNEGHGVVSPDGRWLAFVSDEGGDWQVYLTTWPDLAGKWRVSTEAAAMPQWSRDGRELVFLTARSRLMRASIGDGGAEPEIGLAEEMFVVDGASNYSARRARWTAAPDGERFFVLGAIPGQETGGPDLVLVTNPLGGSERGR